MPTLPVSTTIQIILISRPGYIEIELFLKVVDPILNPILYILFSILYEQASLEQSNSKV